MRPLHGIGEWLAQRLSQATGAEARATVLGHVQRGAMPTAEDRLLASALGVRAVDLLADGKADRMVAWWNRQVIDVPLEKVVGRSRTVDRDGALIRTARALGICLGDEALARSIVSFGAQTAPSARASLRSAGQILARDPEHLAFALLGVEPEEGQAREGRFELARGRGRSRRAARRLCVRCRGASARMRRTRSSPSSPAASARRGSWRYSGGSVAMPRAST